MTLSGRTATLAIAVTAALGVVSGCSKKAPETFTGSAEVGKACVEKAAAAYQVSLNYITISPLIADPSRSYAFAYPGVVQQSSGVSKNFLCRLDAEKNFVDIVTWVPKK